MTKLLQESQRTIIDKKVVDVLCDGCGKSMGPDGNEDSGGYYHLDTDMTFTWGEIYPEGNFTESWSVPDLCQSCGFKVARLLVENGFTVIHKEWDTKTRITASNMDTLLQ